jgi:hypothetical protein
MSKSGAWTRRVRPKKYGVAVRGINVWYGVAHNKIPVLDKCAEPLGEALRRVGGLEARNRMLRAVRRIPPTPVI